MLVSKHMVLLEKQVAWVWDGKDEVGDRVNEGLVVGYRYIFYSRN